MSHRLVGVLLSPVSLELSSNQFFESFLGKKTSSLSSHPPLSETTREVLTRSAQRTVDHFLATA